MPSCSASSRILFLSAVVVFIVGFWYTRSESVADQQNLTATTKAPVASAAPQLATTTEAPRNRPTRRAPCLDTQQLNRNRTFLEERFTMGFQSEWQSKSFPFEATNNQVFGDAFVAKVLRSINERTYLNYADDRFLYRVLRDFPDLFRGKHVVVPGSEKPHYEILLLFSAGASAATTLDYRNFTVQFPGVNVRLVDDYWKSPTVFDALSHFRILSMMGWGGTATLSTQKATSRRWRRRGRC